MRGRGWQSRESISSRRITPACAGKRDCAVWRRAAFWDHPRVCGEETVAQVEAGVTQGSPPRVRGREIQQKSQSQKRRITPACAGKSGITSHPKPPQRDHPRVCGEERLAGLAEIDEEGSPPRVRGRELPMINLAGLKRITPACAGKRLHRDVAQHCVGDHPRVCGEETGGRAVRGWTRGSPPRVRGRATGRGFNLSLTRITPACAGKSYPGRRRISHGSPPRVRGRAGV